MIFGVSGLEDATSWIVGLAFLSALGAVVTGLTDYKDTSPDSAQRDVAGLHGLINIVATSASASPSGCASPTATMPDSGSCWSRTWS